MKLFFLVPVQVHGLAVYEAHFVTMLMLYSLFMLEIG
jgi:hypothetical protein